MKTSKSTWCLRSTIDSWQISSIEHLTAVQIEGLDWLQKSPAFEATAIDEKGEPVRIVAPDPRVWATYHSTQSS
ncbi:MULTISPECIES: GSU2403 family nucleotidyltransferase fold protein [unclassified Bradyrhizobium]|uniref:GSU2403 family nucleotidyltransferase fold protein n=1 Tax=unclassified Bradyrhizobium TaxID=2631580 RepID=UPI001FF8114C|nr:MULTISPECIES: GSU2403 family nucleotidyltransferase fold protein [unclassified Bradyrhizobium]